MGNTNVEASGWVTGVPKLMGFHMFAFRGIMEVVKTYQIAIFFW